jgi:hypothetical protein
MRPSTQTPISAGRLGVQKNQPTKSGTVRQIWVRDLYRLRGDLAHGKVSPRFPSIWKTDEHLLLAAFVFPLLVKSLLSAAGAYTLTEGDEVSIDAFERLAVAPDLGRWTPAGECVWEDILYAVHREHADAAVLKILDAGTS